MDWYPKDLGNVLPTMAPARGQPEGLLKHQGGGLLRLGRLVEAGQEVVCM